MLDYAAHARCRGDRRPGRGRRRAGPDSRAAARRAVRAGLRGGPRRARGAVAPEGQLPPADARGARPGAGRRGAPLGRADRAPARRHGLLLRRVPRRARRGGVRSGEGSGPPVGSLPRRFGPGLPSAPARRRRLSHPRHEGVTMTTPSDNAGEPRSAEARLEVPGSSEEVWAAIATGPGMSAWFVPAEIEEREGGRIALDFGGGMEGGGTITAWEPPSRYVGQEHWGARRL